MRREIKYPLVGLGLGALGGGIFDLLMQYIELDKENKRFWENVDWNRILKNAGKGGVIGAVSGYLVYQLQISQEAKLPFDSDSYLHKVLTENNVKGDRALFELAIRRRNQLKKLLASEFNGILAGYPVNWGSVARGTAVGEYSDFDIIVPFSKGSFTSLEEMYNSTYETLYSKVNVANTEVRKQKRSLGVTFNSNGSELHFDVVPGREINNYGTDKNLNLYVRPDNFWSRPSRMKTNLDAHRNMTINRPEERKVVKLLKLYRDLNGLNIKSTIIQLMVMQAFDRNAPTNSLRDNLTYGMEYIARNLSATRLVDPANSANVLSESLNDYDCDLFVGQLTKDLHRSTNNERYIKEIFG